MLLGRGEIKDDSDYIINRAGKVGRLLVNSATVGGNTSGLSASAGAPMTSVGFDEDGNVLSIHEAWFDIDNFDDPEAIFAP